jgi:hypothetical protein
MVRMFDRVLGAALITFIGVGLLITSALGSHVDGVTAQGLGAMPPCHGRIVRVNYGDRPGCDVQPPQQLWIRLPHGMPRSERQRLADWYGGVLIRRWIKNADY